MYHTCRSTNMDNRLVGILLSFQLGLLLILGSGLPALALESGVRAESVMLWTPRYNKNIVLALFSDEMRECMINGDSAHCCRLMLQREKEFYERHLNDPMDDSILGNIRRRKARELYSHFMHNEDIVVKWGSCLRDPSPKEENLAVCLSMDLDSFVPNITMFDSFVTNITKYQIFWAIMPPDHLVAHRSRISNIDPDSGSPRASSATAMTAKAPMYCSSLNGDAYPCEHPMLKMGQSEFMFKILFSCSRGHTNAMADAEDGANGNGRHRGHKMKATFGLCTTLVSVVSVVFGVAAGVIDAASFLSFFEVLIFILIYVLLAGMALMFLACTFNFFYVSKAPVCDKERKREQKRLRRSQLLMLKLQNARMFLSVKLSELIALLKALHSGWSLPMDLVIRMLNSKFWVMEADVWADLLYICRWANPNISLKDVLCGICKNFWTQPVTSQCGHTFCRFCLLKSKKSKKTNECEICCVKLTFALFTDFNAEKLLRMYKEEHPEEDGSSEQRADQTHDLTDGASTSQATAVIAQGDRKRETLETGSAPPPKKPHTQQGERAIFTTKDLPHLLKELLAAQNKWFNLGLSLGVSSVNLISIQRKGLDDADSLREMLIIRLHSSLSCKELIQALKNPMVGCIVLANDLDSIL